MSDLKQFIDHIRHRPLLLVWGCLIGLVLGGIFQTWYLTGKMPLTEAIATTGLMGALLTKPPEVKKKEEVEEVTGDEEKN